MKPLRRWDGFKDDDGRYQWKAIRRHLRSRFYVNNRRISNRWQDFKARLAGACNADTWTGEGFSGYAGGYSHWRCGKPRSHRRRIKQVNPLRNPIDGATYGPHRFINYTWTGSPNDRVEYNPLPIFGEDKQWFDTFSVVPFKLLADGRHAVLSRRRGRQRHALERKAVRKPRKIDDPRVAATGDTR
jgi:hypothetical protein